MDQQEFMNRWEAGEFPNIVKAETLPAHISDKRGDCCLAVIVGDSEDAGAIVDLVWADVTMSEVRSFPNARFAWVNDGWLTHGDDHSQWGPSLRRIYEDRSSTVTSARNTAAELRRIAEILDPTEDDE